MLLVGCTIGVQSDVEILIICKFYVRANVIKTDESITNFDKVYSFPIPFSY